jgi:hypothetical protein
MEALLAERIRPKKLDDYIANPILWDQMVLWPNK